MTRHDYRNNSDAQAQVDALSPALTDRFAEVLDLLVEQGFDCDGPRNADAAERSDEAPALDRLGRTSLRADTGASRLRQRLQAQDDA